VQGQLGLHGNIQDNQNYIVSSCLDKGGGGEEEKKRKGLGRGKEKEGRKEGRKERKGKEAKS
jgi:hypothetical protein